jgi:hypothetical protein
LAAYLLFYFYAVLLDLLVVKNQNKNRTGTNPAIGSVLLLRELSGGENSKKVSFPSFQTHPTPTPRALDLSKADPLCTMVKDI